MYEEGQHIKCKGRHSMVTNLCLINLHAVERGPLADLATITKSLAIPYFLKGDAGVAVIIFQRQK